MQDDENDEWLTLEQASDRSGYSIDTMRRWVKAGKVQSRKVEGRWVVRLIDLAATSSKTARRTGLPSGQVPARPAIRDASGGQSVEQGMTSAIVGLVHLVGRLHEENWALGAELGYVQAQLSQAQDRIRVLEESKSDEGA